MLEFPSVDVSTGDGEAVLMETGVQSPLYSILSLDASERDTPGDTVRDVLEGLFGEYTPRTQTVTQYLPDGSSVTYQEYVSGVAGMDWDWLASVAIFILILYCLFRLLGGVLTYG